MVVHSTVSRRLTGLLIIALASLILWTVFPKDRIIDYFSTAFMTQPDMNVADKKALMNAYIAQGYPADYKQILESYRQSFTLKLIPTMTHPIETKTRELGSGGIILEKAVRNTIIFKVQLYKNNRLMRPAEYDFIRINGKPANRQGETVYLYYKESWGDNTITAVIQEKNGYHARFPLSYSYQVKEIDPLSYLKDFMLNALPFIFLGLVLFYILSCIEFKGPEPKDKVCCKTSKICD